MKRNTPPKIMYRFFRWFCHPKLRDSIEGDLLEFYHERAEISGKRSADVHFIFDVMLLFRPGIIRPANKSHSVNNTAMFKSYFKIGWRNLIRNKGYSFINIGGLATGMAVALLIGLWIHDELSYDRNFDNYDRIARVVQNQTFDGEIQTWFSQAMQLGPELRGAYSDNFDHVVIATFSEDHKLAVDDQTISKSGSFMQPGAGEMLTLHMLHGTPSGSDQPNGIMISKSTAQALFSSDDVLDRTIKVDNRFDVKVTGVYDDIPANSSFAYLKVILPWQLIAQDLENRVQWGNSWFQCFVQLNEHATMEGVSLKIKDAVKKATAADENRSKLKPELLLHPMSRWRLHSEFENGVSVGGYIQYVWMMGIIGAFVLFLATINFMNLSTARSEKRAKEVGIRKTIGSIRRQLINQFFIESLLVSVMAFVIALILAQLALPWFNVLAGKALSVSWASPSFWMASVGFAVVTGLLAGTYPALFLSSFQPIKVLKGTFKAGRYAGLPRKVLVVVQFTVSVSLIIGTLVIFSQIQFAQNRPIGYDLHGILSVPIRTGEIMNHYEAIRNELIGTGVVEEIAASESPVTSTYTTNSGFQWNGKDPNMSEEFVTVGVTHDFGKVIGWEIAEGKDFAKDMASDSAGFIINEAAARYLGFKAPVGETIKWSRNGEWKIIGVIRNLITQSPYEAVRPMIFFLKSRRLFFINYNIINIRLSPTVGANVAVNKIESIFRKYDTQNAFEYRFADQEFGKKFDNERRIGKMALVSTVLAIFISCLGLFGLASFVAEQRTKEIGIRKVMGASVTQVWQLLSKDFVFLVVIASVIAVPISVYFMNKWLTNYEYRTTVSWGIIVMASAGALMITLITVSFQSVKAALHNPVNSLRSE